IFLTIFDFVWSTFMVNKNFWELEPKSLESLKKAHNCTIFSNTEFTIFIPVIYFLMMHRLQSMKFFYFMWLIIMNIAYYSLIGTLLTGIKINISMITLIILCGVLVIRPFEKIKRYIFCKCVLPYILFLDDVLRFIKNEKKLKYLHFTP
ncbi:conserved membrane protein, unknown function, partial [Hepatocystis sp. ex Piliocolobus tephrosceles]